ncbi:MULTISPECIES: response regulator [unclassified Acidovorax]|uniref:response regulator n=1 Tax=unclassified Acidovorax TaxID=2684926 RepID=UPI001C446F11|nr:MULTISPECIES: response regulator [unclassified Acidovorax]MBV7430291.1 response regulator [Acidovorax sp. sif0732]MBV7451684.1 response regulator [Acidovorax sp. sif0715]
MPRSSSPQAATRFAIPRTLLAGFMVAALATLVIALVNFRASELRADAVDAMDRTTLAMRQLNLLSSALKDAETGQRGYLLTGEAPYLQPYQLALTAVERQMSALKASTADNPVQRRLVVQIDDLAQQKLRELNETIELRKAGNADGAMALVRTDAGKNLMDRVRDLAADLFTLQSQQLEARRQQWVDAATASAYYSWGGSLVLLVLICVSAALTAREYRAKALQSWVAAGLTGLGQRIQGDHRLEDIGELALEYLATYLKASVGAGYAANGHGSFALFGGYALPRERLEQKLLAGEGLVGQAVRSRQLLHVRDVPPGHLQVASGTGQSGPAELLVAPAVENGEVFAVIELGFYRPVGEAERDLMERASEMLAVAIRSGIDRTRLESLLEETQRQSEELQMQQEELRVNNEELEQQSRVLQESQAQMEVQQTELEQTNAHLEEQTQQLEHQREQLLRAQSALTDKARELELSSQYKSEFLANMSHELRTPLNSTLILAKLLSDNKPGNLSGDQVKYAQTIYAAGNDLLALINDILDLSKIEAGQATVTVEPVSIARAVQALVDPLRPLAQERGLALNATVAPDVPATMDTDPLRLGQVLKNLLSNAIKFTEQGSVALHVSRNPGDTLSFVVKDTGIGIPAHQQELIFEAFRQADGSTHRKYGGTGLGLSISRDLAQLLGGHITVESTPGQGSVFTLVLPLQLEAAMPVAPLLPASVRAESAPPADAPARLPVAAPQDAPPPPGTRAGPAPLPRAGARSILIIEDDERFAHILRDLAQEMGFECAVALNAADGMLAATQSLPSAIVLDVNLPDFSGLGVLDQLKRNPATRHIPVHVVSVADYSQEAMGRGAVGYALKPVKREELVHALERLEAKFTQNMHRVLVVEDDERQRESVRHLLSRDGVEIVCAGTAAAALEHLRGATFDCMVMDLNLPDLNGYELLQQMTEQDGVSFPPVIVYTGRALSRDEEQLLRRFSKSIIIKDARSPERLLDEVTLFLHQVESELSAEHRQMLQVARNRDTALEGRTVLVVEDDVRNVFALSSILEPSGIRVEIARNGREALDALARADSGASAHAIDLVLMDIMMPEMDGYTAMREIRARPEWRRLPIIALTAKAMKDDQEKCLAAGANDYIAKPLDVEKLLSLVRVWMPK